MRILAADHPTLAPHSISDFKYTYMGDSVRDIPSIMGLLNYKEENWALVPNFEFNWKK